jgi:pimeloyl-ACP methyl ester carboxylesterase
MLGNVLYGLLALIVFLAVFAVALRSYRRGANRAAIAIAIPPGVQEARFVPIGGIEQWVEIRGEDVANPVLLLLHGGPGNALSGLTYRKLRPLEAHFTVVQWDQRGAGKTYGRHGKIGAGEMSIERMVKDGIELAEWICKDLGQDKILLVGLSWGSLLGTEMAARRPDLFSAYVGTGQVVNMQRGEAVAYDALMERLRARGDAKAMAALTAIGAPPYPDRKALIAQRRLLFKAGSAADRAMMRQLPAALIFAPGRTLKDAWDTTVSNLFSINALYDALMAYDVRHLGTRFEIPMIYLQGADDIQTPTALVEEYFKEIEAPEKALVLLGDGAAHMAMVTHLDAFVAELVKRVGTGQASHGTPLPKGEGGAQA